MTEKLISHNRPSSMRVTTTGDDHEKQNKQ